MNWPMELLTNESRWMPGFLSALVVATISGFLTYFVPTHGVWQQWVYLLHVVVGFLLVAVCVPYGVLHFRRTLPLRRPAVFILGLLAFLVLLGVGASGLHIALLGQQEALRWVYHAHIVTSYAAAALILVHLLAHRLFLPTRRRQTESQWFPTLTPFSYTVCLLSVVLGGGAVFLATVVYSRMPLTYKDGSAITPYELPYGTHPFRPSQTETATGTFIDSRRIAGSEKCGTCHTQITAEWRSSMHGQAASDKTYQTNVNLLAEKKGMAATRFCEGCHAPVALLSGQLTSGGKLDTPGHMEEGVSCLSCHGIDKIVHLQGTGSYRFTPANDYLFADRDNPLLTWIHNFLIKIHPQEHRNDMARPPLGSPQLCATCHTGFMDKEMNGWGWVKLVDDYGAWLNSPFSRSNDEAFSHQQVMRCQDCHLPLVPGDDPSADHNRLARSHRTLGANTAIPYVTGDKEQLQLTTKFLREDKIRVDIEEPNRQQAQRSEQYHMGQKLLAEAESPVYFYLGETARLKVSVINTQVGHNFPGGTIDINEAWIQFRVVDAQNAIVHESGQLLADGTVAPDAYIYQSIPIDRQGSHVWRHDLFNMIGDSYKKVIPSGGADIVEYSFPIPYWVKSPLTVSAVVRYRKLNNRYARWALKDDDIRLPIVDMARDVITLPVRYRPERERVADSVVQGSPAP